MLAQASAAWAYAQQREAVPRELDTFSLARRGVAALDESLKAPRTFTGEIDWDKATRDLFTARPDMKCEICEPKPPCDSTDPYRSADGTCNNNVTEPLWGRAGATYVRELTPQYDDGIDSFRRQKNGAALPSARRVADTATTVDSKENFTDSKLNGLAWAFGQFVMHDIAHTPITEGADGKHISCCDNLEPRPDADSHPACAAMRDDNGGRMERGNCMEFVRSIPAAAEPCKLGPRQQLNQVTGFLDGSTIYGSTPEQQKELRTFQDGKLESQLVGEFELLPGSKDPKQCRNPTQAQPCFLAGDSRVNQQPYLAMMHTVWLRQHNRVAARLAQLNPFWRDEQLFQEARRIVVAQIQHITTNEYLSTCLGDATMSNYHLFQSQGYMKPPYQPVQDPGATNVFATVAAPLLGEGLTPSRVTSISHRGKTTFDEILSKTQLDVNILYKQNEVSNLVRGLINQPVRSVGTLFSSQLTYFYYGTEQNFGLDLVALNIQRGRDHGLPGYADARSQLGLPRPKSFEDLRSLLTDSSVEKLKKLYNSVDDIDLFVGALMEKKTDGLVGPTLQEIIGKQFARTKRSDRFWYENEEQPRPFSPAQLKELRKVTFAKVLCETLGTVQLPRLAFNQQSKIAKKVSCDEQTNYDLSPWRA